jgi:hypothetical protein
MPLPSISRLFFMLLFCSCVLCPTEHTCNSAPPILSKKKFQSNFHPFSPRLCVTNSTSIVPEPCLSVPVSCNFFFLIFRFSKHEESKNRRLSWCFLWARENQNQRTVSWGYFRNLKEPSVEVISETSKNRQLRLFHKHQRTVSWGYFTNIKEPTVFIKEPAKNLCD